MDKDIKHFVSLVTNNKEDLKKNLLILKKGKKELEKGVYVGKNVEIEQNIFFDTSFGDISIGEGTKIKANSILRGPLIIGKDCIINSFAEISCSQIGDVCKIGGEVEGSVIGNYTNKQHHGCLCHSYVGSWVNMGGGTSVSDLKNTYSTISVQGVNTGLQFMGPIICDYVKTAINTAIFCGKVIGPSAHLYGTVTQDVPAFTSHVRVGVMYELPLVLAEKIQIAMTKRRNVEWTKENSEGFKKLFEDSAKDRKLAKVKKGKLKFI